MRSIWWLDDLRRRDVGAAGGKGANLGELTGAGFPVPPGFVVSADAYLASMEAAGVRAELAAPVEATDASEWPAHSDELQTLVRKAGLRADVRRSSSALMPSWPTGWVSGHRQWPCVPLPPLKTRADTSFAGMNKTFTNVRGAAGVAEAVVDAWASLFGQRVVAYRADRRIPGEPAIAVVVQAMVPTVAAGVAFTADPVSGQRDRIVIEGAFGQGEVVVGGRVEPDMYVVAKTTLAILDERIGTKSHKIVAGADGDVHVALEPAEASARALACRRRGTSPRLARLHRGPLRRAPGPGVVPGCRGRAARRAARPDHDAWLRAATARRHSRRPSAPAGSRRVTRCGRRCHPAAR